MTTTICFIIAGIFMIPYLQKGFRGSEGTIVLNPKTSLLYCIQAMMAGVLATSGNLSGALGLIGYLYVFLLLVYGWLSPRYLLNGKVGGTTALAQIMIDNGHNKIARFLNNWGFAFLLGDSVITMLITVTAAAVTMSLLLLGGDGLGHSILSAQSIITEHGGTSTKTFTIVSAIIFGAIVWGIRKMQPLGTNRIGQWLSPIALIWTFATVAMHVKWFDISIFMGSFNPANVLAFIKGSPVLAGAVSLAFLAPTGLEMMYADVSHIGVSNMRKTATWLAFWAMLIYASQVGFLANHPDYAGKVTESLGSFMTTMAIDFGGLKFQIFMAIFTVLASAAAVQSTNVGAQVLVQESSNSGNLFRVSYLFPKGCNGEQGYSPFVADILMWLGIGLGMPLILIMGVTHAAHLFDNMYGPVILVTMLSTAYAFYLLEKKNKGIKSMIARGVLIHAMILEALLILSCFIKIAYDVTIIGGLATTLALALTFVGVLKLHHWFNKIKATKYLTKEEATMLIQSSDWESNGQKKIHLVHTEMGIPAYAIDGINKDLRQGYEVILFTMIGDQHHDDKVLRIHSEQLLNGVRIVNLELSITSPTYLPGIQEKLGLQGKTTAYQFKESDYSTLTILQQNLLRLILKLRKIAFMGFQVDEIVQVKVGNGYNPYDEYQIQNNH